MKFRDLRADEVECRIGTINEKGLTLLLYKDARCDMNVLDETVGAENWQREHYEVKGNMFCRVGICFDGDTWVWKADCGTESYTEKEKGESSDSFKRACFNWGIGRELYTAPFIWISAKEYSSTTANNKPSTRDKFKVVIMDVKDKAITKLRIDNTSKGTTVFEWEDCPPAGEYKDAEIKALEKTMQDIAKARNTPYSEVYSAVMKAIVAEGSTLEELDDRHFLAAKMQIAKWYQKL
ncbi:MAG: hypothetical protein IJN85_00700 [Oscillospiraceae bacterium]|nr:hypothetical protein [Oscillospiraceae bacterium]